MRISDWSSDVCSSDLRAGSGQSFLGHEVMAVALAVGQGERRAVLVEGPGGEMVAEGLVGVHEADHGGAGHHGLGRRIAAGEAQARKSVVEGKSVAVRVDLGGRRSFKKKKQTQA